MIYHYKGLTKDVNFHNFIDLETFLDEMKSKRIKLTDAEKKRNGSLRKTDYYKISR